MQRLRKAAYRPRIARINLYLSDETHAALVAAAHRVKLSPAGLARELVARGVGASESHEAVDQLQREVADLRRRLDALDGRG